MIHSPVVKTGRGAFGALIVAAMLFLDGAARAGTADPCDENLSTTICQSGGCPIGMGCRLVDVNCGCVPIGCCIRTQPSIACNGLMTQEECEEEFGGTFTPNAVCAGSTGPCNLLPSPTATPSITPTSTATNTAAATQTPTRTSTPVPNGGECETSSQCASMVCENGVCTAVAAPALSPNALALALAFLLGLGAIGMWRMRHLR
jgi:hypothetical protein